MQGYICGIADNSRIDYCPICGEALGINAYYGDGTVVCNECDFHFAVIECEEKEHDEDLQNHERGGRLQQNYLKHQKRKRQPYLNA